MKAYIEIEYQRGSWSQKLSFVRAQEIISPEGTALAKEFDLLTSRLRSLDLTPVAPIVELDPALVNTVAESSTSVVEEAKAASVEPEPLPVVPAEVPVPAIIADPAIEQLAADPFAEPQAPAVTEPVVTSSKKNKTAK